MPSTTEAAPSTTEEVVDTTTPEAVSTTTSEAVDTTTPEVVVTTTSEAVDTTTAEAVDTTTSEAVETTSAIMLKRKMNGENITTEASTQPPTTSTQMATNATDAPTTTDMETTAPTDVPTTTTDVPAVECPESVDGFPVFVPHPTDCPKYYECQKDWPILMECAPPLYFDPSISACNWPSQVDCQ